MADLLCVHDEVIDESRPLTLFDPQFTWKKKVVTNFEAKPIQQQIFKDGKCVYKKPAYEDIVKYAASEIDTLWTRSQDLKIRTLIMLTFLRSFGK